MTEQPLLNFSGDTFEPQHDAVRLTGLLADVAAIMRDGQWRTLDEIRVLLAADYDRSTSDASISARLRDFRKDSKGAHTVNRRRRKPDTAGLFEYQLVMREAPLVDVPTALKV